MTLSEWAAHHKDEVVVEPATSKEIRSLLAVLDRELRDADSAASTDGQFIMWVSRSLGTPTWRPGWCEAPDGRWDDGVGGRGREPPPRPCWVVATRYSLLT